MSTIGSNPNPNSNTNRLLQLRRSEAAKNPGQTTQPVTTQAQLNLAKELTPPTTDIVSTLGREQRETLERVYLESSPETRKVLDEAIKSGSTELVKSAIAKAQEEIEAKKQAKANEKAKAKPPAQAASKEQQAFKTAQNYIQSILGEIGRLNIQVISNIARGLSDTSPRQQQILTNALSSSGQAITQETKADSTKKLKARLVEEFKAGNFGVGITESHIRVALRIIERAGGIPQSVT